MKQRAAAAAFVGLLLTLTACDGEDAAPTAVAAAEVSPSTDEEKIQRVFGQWTLAMSTGNFEAMCSAQTEKFNDELVSEAQEAFEDQKVTCEMALRAVTAGAQSPDSSLTEIEVSGAKARGLVDGSTWRFARDEGAWKVACGN